MYKILYSVFLFHLLQIHLKVTIERDLYVARKFESNPVLWDICELIAKAGSLQHCSVLIQALMAVQLCRWSAATAQMDKLEATQK